MWVFLDDERNPEDVTWLALPAYDWDILRTRAQFENQLLAFGIPDFISFDNDLGASKEEGIHCAQWMVDQVLDGYLKWNPNFTFIVHSKNNIAAERIYGLLSPFVSFMNNNA